MIGKTPHEVFDTETAELVEANDRKLLESGTSFYLPEHRVETRNGPRIVTSNRIAVRNQSGEVQYVLGVVEDVTERKQLDDQLRQAKARHGRQTGSQLNQRAAGGALQARARHSVVLSLRPAAPGRPAQTRRRPDTARAGLLRATWILLVSGLQGARRARVDGVERR